jgi:hypothetical protein
VEHISHIQVEWKHFNFEPSDPENQLMLCMYHTYAQKVEKLVWVHKNFDADDEAM